MLVRKSFLIAYLFLALATCETLLKNSQTTANPVGGIANATSGYLSVNDPNNDSRLFYVFYQCRGLAPGQAASSLPLVIWLQGGRGEGSEIGNFLEMGPYSLGSSSSSTNGGYREVPRKVSWNDHYNLLFIDGPRGAGYSIADGGSFVASADEAAIDFLNALVNFYSLENFEAFQKTPMYIFGQDFAGYYIPALVEKILDYNMQKPSFSIPFSGLGIGNGFVDLLHQLTENGLFGFSTSLIDDLQKEDIETLQLQGIEEILRQNYINAQNYFDRIINVMTSYAGGVNKYNYRQFGDYDFGNLVAFMNDPDTTKRYNVDPSVAGKFAQTNPVLFTKVLNNLMQNTTSQMIRILNTGFPVLFYNGQDDVVCNTPGVQSWITNLPWAGQEGYYQTGLSVWATQNGGQIAGLKKNYQNLHFAIIRNAGHYAPMDQIEITTDMISNFIN